MLAVVCGLVCMSRESASQERVGAAGAVPRDFDLSNTAELGSKSPHPAAECRQRQQPPGELKGILGPSGAVKLPPVQSPDEPVGRRQSPRPCAAHMGCLPAS